MDSTSTRLTGHQPPHGRRITLEDHLDEDPQPPRGAKNYVGRNFVSPGPIRFDIEDRRGDARKDFAQVDLLGGIVAG